MPALDAAQAEEAMGKTIAILEDAETNDKIMAVVAEVNALPLEQQGMAKMAKLMPAVSEAIGASTGDAAAACAVLDPS
jgi:hypothetical protein